MAKTKRPPQTTKKLGGPRVAPDGPRKAKVDAVADFKSRVEGSAAVILTEYRGLTVGELAELRAGLRDAGADYKVFKNTLASIAVRDLGMTDLEPMLDGPTAVAFANDDVVNAAKKLADFAKRVPALVLKGGLLDGRVLTDRDVQSLASLDSREVMLAKIAGLFASPLQKLAYLFAAPLQQVGGLFAQLKDKLPEAPADAAGAPAAEQPATAAQVEPASREDADAEATGEAATAEATAGDTEATTSEPQTPEAGAPEGDADQNETEQ